MKKIIHSLLWFKVLLLDYPVWFLIMSLFVPLLVAVIGIVLPAFGYFPVLGFTNFSWEPWLRLFAAPGLLKSIGLTLFIGISATSLSLALAVFITASFYTSGIYKILQNTLAPLLAIPHLSIAVGIAFLLAPSGFIFRILASLNNWETPPNLIIVPDTYGLVMILTLCLKELPFFLFIINGALTQVNAPAHITIARSMGYNPYTAWFKVVVPQIYPRIKLPLVIVLIFSLSVVDIAIFLAPNAPPPFAVMLLQWFYDPDLSMRLTAAAGGVLLMGIIMLVLLVWWLLEQLLLPLWGKMVSLGGRGKNVYLTKPFSYLALVGTALLAFAALLLMLIWSFSLQWRFPAVLPQQLGLANWLNYDLHAPLSNSLMIACLVTGLAVFMVISLLELTKSLSSFLLLFYLPLLVPQIIFIFGFDLLLILLDLKGFWGVVWGHWLYVLPYVFLILYIPYKKFDSRYEQIAYCLGSSRLRTLLRVKLPMLLRPIIYAFAVGFAVSINEYLPTLIPGAGRVDTLTTEMVALAAGGDRRIISVTSVVQAALPCLVFIIALLLPSLQARFRRGLAV